MTRLPLILTIAASTVYGMHDAMEDRLLSSDERRLQAMADHNYALAQHIERLNDELDRKDFDLMLVRDALALFRKMQNKPKKDVATQTDLGPFLLRRCPGSPDLTNEQ